MSGRLKRAPAFFQRAGLEWLWRAIREPSRLPRLTALPKFVWMAAAEGIRRYRRPGGGVRTTLSDRHPRPKKRGESK
jgi:hypothetical protein